MSTVSLKAGGLNHDLKSLQNALETGGKTAPEISFASLKLMHRVLTPKRVEIIGALCGQPPMSIRKVSRRVGRDSKGVHTDVTALIASGLVEQEEGKISFPYDRIHVEFDIDVAA